MTTIYELELNVLPGTLLRRNIQTIDIKLQTYPAKFLIKEYDTCTKKVEYVVFYNISDILLKCGIFSTFLECTMYINRAMKVAMRGMFVFKICSNCLQKIYYPEDICGDCDNCPFIKTGYVSRGKWFIERKIENISEHMSRVKTHEEHRTKGVRECIEEYKKLLNL